MSAPPFEPPLNTPAAEPLPNAHLIPTSDTITPASNSNPNIVPKPERVAGYKQGSLNAPIVKDKSTKLHTAVQAASYWQVYGQAPVTAPGSGNGSVEAGLQGQQPLIDHPFPMDTYMQDVVIGGSGAVQDAGPPQSFIQQTPMPNGVRQGSVPPQGVNQAVAPTSPQLQQQEFQSVVQPQNQPQHPPLIARQGSAQSFPQPPQLSPAGARQGSVPPQSANQARALTMSQLWLAQQQALIQQQQSMPVGTLQGSLLPLTSFQFQQQGFQSIVQPQNQPQHPLPIALQGSAQSFVHAHHGTVPPQGMSGQLVKPVPPQRQTSQQQVAQGLFQLQSMPQDLSHGPQDLLAQPIPPHQKPTPLANLKTSLATYKGSPFHHHLPTNCPYGHPPSRWKNSI
ncbi:hypothetical protein LXA43DRAFT_1062878 [Ganoderma leucocontextum]|nr:hypothetical protein LXA43DRAFT_1062878 [Ganoderma leucocontextum]